MKMNMLDWIAWILVIVGGLNWGLVGFFDYNLVDSLFSAGSTLSAIIYDLVGISALYLLLMVGKMKSN